MRLKFSRYTLFILAMNVSAQQLAAQALCDKARSISVAPSPMVFCLGRTTAEDIRDQKGVNARLMTTVGVSDSGVRFTLAFSSPDGSLKLARAYVPSVNESAAQNSARALAETVGSNFTWSECADSAGSHYPLRQCRKTVIPLTPDSSISVVVGYYVVPGASGKADLYNVMFAKELAARRSKNIP